MGYSVEIRFKQIAATRDGDNKIHLFALDGAGRLWLKSGNVTNPWTAIAGPREGVEDGHST